MKTVLRTILAALLCLASFSSLAASIATCTGRFPNPITDICWSCILPLSIGGATIGNVSGQEDNGNPGTPVCSCEIKGVCPGRMPSSPFSPGTVTISTASASTRRSGVTTSSCNCSAILKLRMKDEG